MRAQDGKRRRKKRDDDSDGGAQNKEVEQRGDEAIEHIAERREQHQRRIDPAIAGDPSSVNDIDGRGPERCDDRE